MLQLTNEVNWALKRGGSFLNRFFRQAMFYIVILLIAMLMINFFNRPFDTPKKLTYDEFITLVNNGQVEEVNIVDREITGKLKDETKFESFNVESDDTLTQRLLKRASEIGANPQSWLVDQYCLCCASFYCLMVIFFIFMQQTQGGGSR